MFSNKIIVKLYSSGRIYFMNKFYTTPPLKNQQEHSINDQSRTLWGIKFNSPMMNSAGMFKNGEGYDLVASLGAGGYIGGTSTPYPRVGNIKNGIKLPFITLPDSDISINYLGLPNLGDEILCHKIITTNKIDGCPIGWSVMRCPNSSPECAISLLVDSLFKFHENNLIDFIEINESCPNVKADLINLAERLHYIAENFLIKRTRNFPVILKLSNDTQIEAIPEILDLMFKYKYDGINFGNTSLQYEIINKTLIEKDKKLFNYFTHKFGGGVGGCYLKSRSLELCKTAVSYKNKIQPDYEFHVIRTGGIDCRADIEESNKIGVSLNQWYTGFFKNYISHGNAVYKEFYI